MASGEITIETLSANIVVGVDMGAYMDIPRPAIENRGERVNVFKTRLYLGNATAGQVEYEGQPEPMVLEVPHHLGEIEMGVRGEWDRDFIYSIKATGPAPITVLAVDPEVEET